MNYKVLSHDYTNTGGNCMVSTFQVWLEDENKTVFLHMNDEGGTLATCDYINHEIEFVEDMMLENFNVESIGDDDKYLELYRYGYFEYLKKDCVRFRTTYSVRLMMFPTELLSNIRNEYIEWHLENIGEYFETNGEELLIEKDYEGSAYKVVMTRETYNAINNFKRAFELLSEHYDSRLFEFLSDRYPFSYSFDELSMDVGEWCDDLVEDVMVD